MININNIYAARLKLADCLNKADFSVAMHLASEILNYYTRIGDKGSEAYGEDLFNIALAFENAGDYKTAIRMYTESSRVVMEHCGENADLFYRLLNIAIVYCKTGECIVALELLNSIVDGLRRKKIVDDNLKFLCYYNIGSTLCSLSRYEEGIDNLKKARKHCKDSDDSNHFDVLYLLGIAHQEQGEHRKSSLYFIEASKVIRRAEPQNISELLNVLVSLSDAYEKMGAYNKSIEKLSEVLRLMDNLLAKKNRAYANIQMKLAAIQIKLGANEKAIETSFAAVLNIKNLTGENSLQYANALRDMALICKEAKVYETGIDCLKKDIEIKAELLGADNRETVKDTISLISLYVEIKELKQALDLLIQTLNVMDNGETELDEFMSKLAELYLSLGEYGNFHSVYSRSIELNKPVEEDGEDYLE